MDQNQIKASEIDENEELQYPNELIFNLEQFHGPLSVLLTLVAKNKMDIKDIQISVLCDQYAEYIESMQTQNIELAAEFIVMAAHLMYIKSKILLPREDEDEIDPREELARALMLQAEYERAKEASQELNGMFSQFSGRIVKDTDEIAPDRTYVAEHDVHLLSVAIIKIMHSLEAQPEEDIASEKIKPLISTRTVSVTERVYFILRLLLTSGGRVNALDCFDGIGSMHELVATFMAILEMLKAGRLTIMEDLDAIQKDGVVDLGDNIYLNLYPGKIRNASEESNG